MKGAETDETEPHCKASFVCKHVAQGGGRGRDRRKEEKEKKGNEGVPSYDASVQGHTKRKREGFPAMTKASRDTQARRKGKEKSVDTNAGTEVCVQTSIQSISMASLAWLGNRPSGPLLL